MSYFQKLIIRCDFEGYDLELDAVIDRCTETAEIEVEMVMKEVVIVNNDTAWLAVLDYVDHMPPNWDANVCWRDYQKHLCPRHKKRPTR